ncbi:MAG TPA: glycosyltransferase [archaeon]|nr:glycosyltransferase [archaeon]
MDASIIIPAYNSQKTIKGCIEALQNQIFDGDYEIIVVDDGSTDETAKIAKSSGAKVILQSNSGPAKARNAGARKAKCKIFVFTDSDCIAQKNWLSEMLSPFKDPKVVGVQGAYKTEQKSLLARFSQIEIEERYELMKKADQLDWIGSYSAAYRKEDFFEAGGFDESFPKASGEDPELSYKISKKGKKLVFNPNAIVLHTHPDTLEKYLKTKYYRAFYRVDLYSKHKDKIVKDSYTTFEIKLQIISSYAGTIFFFLSLALIYFRYEFYGFVALAISTGFTIIGFASGLKFTLFAIQRDFWAGIFSLLAVPLRTTVFSLGLIAGYIRKVLK